MKKVIFILSAILLLSSFTAPRHKPELKCFLQTAKFKVDGKTNDWKTDSLKFDTKTGFAYAFSNDSQSLFVQLKMLNVKVQRKALITGLTLWIDPNGKGKQILGIEYPKGRMHEQRAANRRHNFSRRPGQQNPNRNRQLTPEKIQMFNNRYLSEKPELKGFEKAGIKDAFVGEGGIKVLLQMDTVGHVVYEAKIPLKMLFSNPADYLSKNKPFSILFETGYIRIDMSRMQTHGGMGGGRGSMGGGNNPSRMAFMQSMADPSRLKIKTVHLFQEK